MELRKLVPSEWDVDIDYRRHAANPKRTPNGKLVEVDLLIHHRGKDGESHNLLVAEFKIEHAKTFDWEVEGGDGYKVLGVQEAFGHKVGALVSFGDSATDIDPKIMFNVTDGHRDLSPTSIWNWRFHG